MTALDWIKIILEVIKLIAEGMSKADAVGSVASRFGVSESEIWRHGGF